MLQEEYESRVRKDMEDIDRFITELRSKDRDTDRNMDDFDAEEVCSALTILQQYMMHAEYMHRKGEEEEILEWDRMIEKVINLHEDYEKRRQEKAQNMEKAREDNMLEKLVYLLSNFKDNWEFRKYRTGGFANEEQMERRSSANRNDGNDDIQRD